MYHLLNLNIRVNRHHLDFWMTFREDPEDFVRKSLADGLYALEIEPNRLEEVDSRSLCA